jgi:hypothetical protein
LPIGEGIVNRKPLFRRFSYLWRKAIRQTKRHVLSGVNKHPPPPKLAYSSDLEERLDRALSPMSNKTPVSRAIALVPDAASISGALFTPQALLGHGGGGSAHALPMAISITVAPASNLCRMFIEIILLFFQ